MKNSFFNIFTLFFLILNVIFSPSFSDIKSLFNDETLIISNFPEAINSPGLIFEKLLDKSSLRVMYHHKNSLDEKLTLLINITNTSDKSVDFDIQYGLGGSSTDVVFAGHKSAKDFMHQLLVTPKAMSLPPKSTAVIIKHIIKPHEVSSGHVRVASREKNTLLVKMGVIDEVYPQLSMFKDIPQITSQFKVIEADKSSVSIVKEFDCVQKIDLLEIGGKPYIKDMMKNYELKGNYGLMYCVDLTLVNSELKPKEIKLFFSPKKDNAIDRGVLVIDDKIKEIGILTQKNEVVSMQEFYNTMLKPKESKEVSFVLFPQAGCYYPVDIIIKSGERLL